MIPDETLYWLALAVVTVPALLLYGVVIVGLVWRIREYRRWQDAAALVVALAVLAFALFVEWPWAGSGALDSLHKLTEGW
jgi:hypothetical protein